MCFSEEKRKTKTFDAHNSVCIYIYTHIHTSLEAQMVKNLPTMRETQVGSLGQEDNLEKEMATRSSILAWKIPWTEETGRLLSLRSQRVRHDWTTKNSCSPPGDLRAECHEEALLSLSLSKYIYIYIYISQWDIFAELKWSYKMKIFILYRFSFLLFTIII